MGNPFIKFIFFVLLIPGTFLSAQNVGIGVAAPLDKLHVAGNVRVNPLAGVGTRLVGSDVNGTLVNIAAGANGQVLTQTPLGPMFQNAAGGATVTSVALTTDIAVTSLAWANIAGISVTFTATKTTALVMLSAAGFAYSGSMSYVQFRVRDGVTSLGGTNAHLQDNDFFTGATVTPWSCSFIKNITGLTIGNSYTYQVQGSRDGIIGTYDAAIYSASYPDSQHLTLTVLQ